MFCFTPGGPEAMICVTLSGIPGPPDVDQACGHAYLADAPTLSARREPASPPAQSHAPSPGVRAKPPGLSGLQQDIRTYAWMCLYGGKPHTHIPPGGLLPFFATAKGGARH